MQPPVSPWAQMDPEAMRQAQMQMQLEQMQGMPMGQPQMPGPMLAQNGTPSPTPIPAEPGLMDRAASSMKEAFKTPKVVRTRPATQKDEYPGLAASISSGLKRKQEGK